MEHADVAERLGGAFVLLDVRLVTESDTAEELEYHLLARVHGPRQYALRLIVVILIGKLELVWQIVQRVLVEVQRVVI